jgi:hypothetical protein
MPNVVKVTSRQGWLSRIVKSIVGVFVGLILVVVALPLLWWNEGRAVHRARSLEEGAAIVVEGRPEEVGAANEGKLVHLTGLATTDETLLDPEFGLGAKAIRLERIAETYQWRERSSSKKTRKLGGSEETTTTYQYETTWSRTAIDSASFHSPEGHQNPGSLQWESTTLTARRVTLGAFLLSQDVIAKMGGGVVRPGGEDDAEKMRARGFIESQAGVFYNSANPQQPSVGDVRVRFEVILPQTVSLVAAQRGPALETYHARAGSDILFVETGTVSAARMFESAMTTNRITTWAVRAGGFLGMFLGLVLILRPIAVVGSVVPAIGRVLGAGTGLVSFVFALALSCTTIAVAWLAYRPLLAVGLLAGGAAGLVLLLRARRKKVVVPPPIPAGRT